MIKLYRIKVFPRHAKFSKLSSLFQNFLKQLKILLISSKKSISQEYLHKVSIKNETGHLLKCVRLYRNFINTSEIQQTLSKIIAANSLKTICKHLYSRQSYANVKVLAFSKRKSFSWGLKGTATLMICLFYKKDVYKPWDLILVSSKSIEKCKRCGRFTICKWAVMEAAILQAE